MTETVATDLDSYADLAVNLSRDLPRLARMRAELRDRVARSPVCDSPRFANDFGRALRDVWRQWCLSGNLQVH